MAMMLLLLKGDFLKYAMQDDSRCLEPAYRNVIVDLSDRYVAEGALQAEKHQRMPGASAVADAEVNGMHRTGEVDG